MKDTKKAAQNTPKKRIGFVNKLSKTEFCVDTGFDGEKGPRHSKHFTKKEEAQTYLDKYLKTTPADKLKKERAAFMRKLSKFAMDNKGGLDNETVASVMNSMQNKFLNI